MVLSDEQKKLLRKSSKTLAIIGKFTTQGELIYAFSNQATENVNGVVSAEAFFTEAKPALALKVDGTVKLGKSLYNTYKVATPLTAPDDSDVQIITSDSPLLSVNEKVFDEATVKLMQKHGGKLVKELVSNLDKLAHFSHSNFSKSILKIARDYMYHAALEELGTFTQRIWFDALSSDYKLSSEVAKYLTAYEQDEQQILDLLSSHLGKIQTIEEPKEQAFTKRQQTALLKALERCKRVMKDGIEDDPIWDNCRKFESNLSWLDSYAGNDNYGLPSLHFVGGKEFLKYYQTFLTTSEEVHRLVRSQALHPYIFTWLSSKYASWDEGEFNKASDPMYDIGVEGQGDKRIPGETHAERAEMFRRIQSAPLEEEVDKELRDDEDYNNFTYIVEDHTFSALLADRAVTAASLRHRAKKLFSLLGQLAGGKVGQLLSDLDKFNALFVPLYRIIKNTRPENEEEGYKLSEFKERLENVIGEKIKERFPEIDDFIDTVINNSQQEWSSGSSDQDLKTIVTNAFISAYASVSKNHFARQYLENRFDIKEEIRVAEELYDVIRNQQQVSAQSDVVGSPVVSVVETVFPSTREKNKKVFRDDIFQQQAEQISEQRDPIIAQTPKHEMLVNQGVETGSFKIVNSKGEELASANIKPDSIEYKVEQDKAEEFLQDDAKLVVDQGDENFEVLVTELDFPKEDVNEVLKQRQQETDDILDLANKNAQLAEKQNQIVKAYEKDDADRALSNSLRSLMLCEYILAVPKSQSQLGKPDISNILGLMVDVVEHLVEPNDSKVIDGVLVQDGDPTPELSRINLSKYYPVANRDELWDIVNYQYQLAKELSSVRDYLQELAEIRDFIDALGETDIDLIFVNSTLKEQAQVNQFDQFIPHAHSPAVVYLTTQAQTSQGLNTMAERVVELIGDKNAKNLQMPIFVSPEELPENLTKNAGLPVISVTDLQLPPLKAKPSKEGFVVDKIIQEKPYLLLAAAIMVNEGSQALGNVDRLDISTDTGFKRDYNIAINTNQTLSDVLRELWLKSKKPLLDNLIFVKWLNLLFLAMQTDKNIRLGGKGIASKLEDILRKNTFEEALFTLNPVIRTSEDITVFIKDRDNFLAPAVAEGGIDTFLKSTFGSRYRQPLNVSFKDSFHDLVKRYE